MTKRILAALLAVAMMTTMAPFAFAEGTQETGSQEAGAFDLSEEIKQATDGSIIKLSDSVTAYLQNGVANEGNNARTVTIQGDGSQIVDVIQQATYSEGGMLSYQRGSNFTFENVTIQAGEGNFDGIVCDSLTFKNCTIKGKLTLYGAATFENCTFENTMENQYSIWTWGGTTVNVTDCTFNTNGKAILLYGQATDAKPTNLTVTGCTFNDRKDGAAGKAAIEIGNEYNATYNLKINDITVNGFAPGKNTGSKLWANKNSMKADKLSVTIDGQSIPVEPAASVGTEVYGTLQEAVGAAETGATVKVLKNIDLASTVEVSGKTITLDVNGKTITNSADLWDESTGDWSLISVRKNGKLTITGNGALKAKENDCYTVDVQDGSTLTIENGTFVGNVHAVYVLEGTAYIKGGTYSVLQKYPGVGKEDEFVLNLYDANRMNGTAKMIVTGGTFEKFNPANCQAEGKGTNFCADSYTTVKSGDNYTVKATNAKNITDLDEAIKTIQDESSKTADIKQATSVIKNIDNADLASNSDAMSKLAALDEELTDSTEGSAKVIVTANSTVSGIDANEVKVTNAALSADLTQTTQEVKINIAGANVADNTVTEAKKLVENASGDVQKLDIRMTVNGTEVKNPTAPVVVEFPLPTGWKGCQIVCVDDPTNPELIPTTVVNGTVRAVFNHFSDYVSVQTSVITSPNKYQINLKPQDDKTTVYAGDTITFDVELEQTAGDVSDKIGQFSFKPDSTMLDVDSITLNTPFREMKDGTISATSQQGIALENKKLAIGTITYKVKANTTQHTMLTVTADSESSVSAVGGKYTIGSGLTVADTNVYYEMIHVWFTNYKNDGTAGTTTYYTSAGSKVLYASLADLASRDVSKKVTAPTPKDGSAAGKTQYRLTDDAVDNELNNWVAADNTKYVDLVSDRGAGFTQDINFQVSRVELLEVSAPADVVITSKTTTRDSKTYVDKNAELTFTAPAASAGMKNDVTVTVGSDTNKAEVTEADVAGDSPKKQYTVAKDKMSASPVTITVAQVIDLDASDIKTFDDDAGSYLTYSAYSGNDTLVLIKGAAGVKYTLTGADAPEIFELPGTEMDRGYGDGFNLAVLIPKPTTGTHDSATMLAYLKTNYNIAVEAGSNTKLGAYDFDTNGVNSFKNDDVQATYDFSALNDIAWKPSDDLLLKADVLTYSDANGTYNTARDGQVTTKDVDAFLYNYRYTPADRPTDTDTQTP